MRKANLILGGIGILVGLGFVMPQWANLQANGHLVAADVLLYTLGLTVTLGGAACIALGVRRSGALGAQG